MLRRVGVAPSFPSLLVYTYNYYPSLQFSISRKEPRTMTEAEDDDAAE